MDSLKSFNYPTYILQTIKTLQKAGHEAYIVGGSVRDILVGIARLLGSPRSEKLIKSYARRCLSDCLSGQGFDSPQLHQSLFVASLSIQDPIQEAFIHHSLRNLEVDVVRMENGTSRRRGRPESDGNRLSRLAGGYGNTQFDRG